MCTSTVHTHGHHEMFVNRVYSVLFTRLGGAAGLHPKRVSVTKMSTLFLFVEKNSTWVHYGQANTNSRESFQFCEIRISDMRMAALTLKLRVSFEG